MSIPSLEPRRALLVRARRRGQARDGCCARRARCSRATASTRRCPRSPPPPGAGVGSVYRQFPSKHDLLAALVVERLSDAEARSRGRARERRRAVAGAHRRCCGRSPSARPPTTCSARRWRPSPSIRRCRRRCSRRTTARSSACWPPHGPRGSLRADADDARPAAAVRRHARGGAARAEGLAADARARDRRARRRIDLGSRACSSLSSLLISPIGGGTAGRHSLLGLHNMYYRAEWGSASVGFRPVCGVPFM